LKQWGRLSKTIGKEIRNLDSSKNKHVMRKGKTRYYDRKQQLELVLAAQGLLEDVGTRTVMQGLGVKKSMLTTQVKLTSGRMRFVWDCWKKVSSQTQSIFRRLREQKNGQSNIAGRMFPTSSSYQIYFIIEWVRPNIKVGHITHAFVWVVIYE